MTWFSLVTGLVQILVLILQRADRGKIVADTEAVERAKTLHAINKSLAEAAKVPASLASLTDKELDEYVQKKGWYRD
jgi:hypothetical protein